MLEQVYFYYFLFQIIHNYIFAIYKIAHAYQPPGGGGGVGGGISTFYVAFNTPAYVNNSNSSLTIPSSCGIIAARVATSAAGSPSSYPIIQISPCDTATTHTNYQIQAFSVLPSPLNDGVWVYIIYYTNNNSMQDDTNVQLIKWNTISPDVSSGAVDEIFFFSPTISTSKKIHMGSLSIIWPNVNFAPTFFALVESKPIHGDSYNIIHPEGPPLLIQTADNVQRTFTAIQGMPGLSHPTLLRATGTGVGNALLVAAYGSTLYTIPATRCSSSSSSVDVPRYWDGKQCAEHICIRSRSCIGNIGQIWFVLPFFLI